MAGDLVIRTINSKDISSSLVATESQVIGVGQTWQTVTGSRAFNTTYTNTTDKPRLVKVIGNTTNGALNYPFTANINSVGLIEYARFYASGNGQGISASILIPSGNTYSINIGGATLSAWYELT